MKKLLVFTLMLLLTVGLFAGKRLDKLATVEVKNSQIVATYTIPEDMHMYLQKDFFYLDVDENENVVFEETVYPEGHADEDGMISFEGSAQLTKKFTLKAGVKPEDVIVKVYAGYQMCYDAYCEPPVDLETDLCLKEKKVLEAEKIKAAPVKAEKKLEKKVEKSEKIVEKKLDKAEDKTENKLEIETKLKTKSVNKTEK